MKLPILTVFNFLTQQTKDIENAELTELEDFVFDKKNQQLLYAEFPYLLLQSF